MACQAHRTASSILVIPKYQFCEWKVKGFKNLPNGSTHYAIYTSRLEYSKYQTNIS